MNADNSQAVESNSEAQLNNLMGKERVSTVNMFDDSVEIQMEMNAKNNDYVGGKPSKSGPTHFSDEAIQERLLGLEGECRIKSFEYLLFSWPRAIFAMVLITISFFGLFALKYSAWFRKKAFYNCSDPEAASHLYVKGNGKSEAVVKIENPGQFPINFVYLKLKYFVSSPESPDPIPEAFVFERDYQRYFSEKHRAEGLSNEQIQRHLQRYGANTHLVQIPNYFSYLLDVMTGPFFLLQYFFCFIYFIQGYASFSIALFSFSFLTTTINYIMLYMSFRRIKEIAQKKIQVEVIRNGDRQKIDSHDLVPGDIYIPEEQTEICADCIVVNGDIYVNEANLTGESFPIGKFQIKSSHEVGNSNVWLYEGAKILEVRKGMTHAIVINTGFTTTRGRIIRRILNREVRDPDLLRSILIFVLEMVSIGFIVYLATLPVPLSIDIQPIFILFKLVDFLASSAPPPLPIYFNLAYTMCLFRLRFKDVSGTEPEKTVDGAQVKTFCFDKTGTLTKSDVEVRKIMKLKSSEQQKKDKFSRKKLSVQDVRIGEMESIFEDITEDFMKIENKLIWQLFSTCHTTKLIRGELLGDEIDRHMFGHTQAEMTKSDDPEVRFIIRSSSYADEGMHSEKSVKREGGHQSSSNAQCLHVLKVNQFESRFQSMSVLVTDMVSKKSYIFIKGAPEKLLENSLNISQADSDNPSSSGTQYSNMVKILSLNGLRTIAIGYREILSSAELQMLKKAERQTYEKGITLLGLVAFENMLKDDTFDTMQNLIRSSIEPKMITGDNIYIAVETARRAGIVMPDERIVFLEGKKQLTYAKFSHRDNAISTLLKNKSKLLESVKSDSDSEAANNEDGNRTPGRSNLHLAPSRMLDETMEDARFGRKFIGTIVKGSRKFVKQRKEPTINKIANSNNLMSEGAKIQNENKRKDIRIHPMAEKKNPKLEVLSLQPDISDVEEEDEDRLSSSDFEEQVVTIYENKQYLQNYTYAVDNAFLTFFEPHFSDRIKIFARIPPESKALVIRAYKNQNKSYLLSNQSKFRRFLKVDKLKIGMCGDGANDLLALKEADLSIGIQETDASYGSSFTVQNIKDVYEVIRESKCTQSNLMQLFRFYIGIPFLIVISSILMLADATYFSASQLIYINFGTMLLLPGAMAFSRPPSQKDEIPEDARYTPDGNMMSLHSHLLVWGNILFPFSGILAAYFYFYNTPEFQYNPQPKVSISEGGFNSQNHSATVIFLLSILACVCNGFIMYRGRPWKEPFYRNYLFTLIVVGNLAVALAFPFLLNVRSLKTNFQFVTIGRKYMGAVIGIFLGSEVLNYFYNQLVNYFKLDHRILQIPKAHPEKQIS